MNYDELLAPAAKAMRPSGIRKFFDLAADMPHCISLGVGEPDFKTPWSVRDAGIRSLELGRTKYTANSGLKELRGEICNYLQRRFDLHYKEENILVTVGGSEAIDLTIRAVVQPGDEVIIPEPCFVCYEPITQLTGGVPVHIATCAEDQFRLTADQLRAAITPRTKLLIFPYPNNPTGAVMSAAGDVLLHEPAAKITAPRRGGKERPQPGGVLNEIHLAPPREIAAGVGRLVRGLGDDRPAKRQRRQGVRRAQRHGLRCAQPRGAAGRSKLPLIGQMQRCGRRAGKAVRPAQRVGMAGQQGRVVVGAGDENFGHAGVLRRQPQQRGRKDVVLPERRVLHGDPHQTAVGQRGQGAAADGQAAHAIAFIKAASHAVDIGIPAQQHRQHPRHTNPPCRKCMRQGGFYVVIV